MDCTTRPASTSRSRLRTTVTLTKVVCATSSTRVSQPSCRALSTRRSVSRWRVSPCGTPLRTSGAWHRFRGVPSRLNFHHFGKSDGATVASATVGASTAATSAAVLGPNVAASNSCTRSTACVFSVMPSSYPTSAFLSTAFRPMPSSRSSGRLCTKSRLVHQAVSLWPQDNACAYYLLMSFIIYFNRVWYTYIPLFARRWTGCGTTWISLKYCGAESLIQTANRDFSGLVQLGF